MSFVYHANALAFGGVLRNPCCDVIPSTGVGRACAERRRGLARRSAISTTKASSRSTKRPCTSRGSQSGKLPQHDRDGRHPQPERPEHDPRRAAVCARDIGTSGGGRRCTNRPCEEPEFTFEGSIIENVRIAGRRTNITLDHSVFSRYPKHSDFVTAFAAPAAPGSATTKAPEVAAASHALWERYAQRFCWPAGKDAPCKRGVIRASRGGHRYPELPDEDFSDKERRRINDKREPVRRNGYIVRIADFGTIAIGEVILKEQQRTVNMLRFNLGSPIDGSGTACSGTTQWP